VQKNTSKVWDSVWLDPGLVKNDELILAAEAATTRWRKLHAVLTRELGSLSRKKVLEIGSGIGTYAALLAKEGSDVTLLDYSPAALRRAKEFFRHNELHAGFTEGDGLHLGKYLKKEAFDITISVGLTEHFSGQDRITIHRSHLDVLKPGGIAVFIIPNALNPSYRLYKFFSELTGTWKFGEEYPFSKRELRSITAQINAKEVALFGDDLYTSLRFLLPANFLRRAFGVGIPRSASEIRQEKGTPLDDIFGYSFVLVVRK
jgi:SAM-dependent methyltransferase